MAHSTVYASASTQMVVDSPQSALANAGTDLTGYLARANVFARLMTSLRRCNTSGKRLAFLAIYRGYRAGRNSLARRPPLIRQRANPAGRRYRLQAELQARLPPESRATNGRCVCGGTDHQAGGRAGERCGHAGSRHTSNHCRCRERRPNRQAHRVRELGAATGGVVDPGASKAMAGLIFVAVLALWCGLVLSVSNLRNNCARQRQAGANSRTHVSIRPRRPLLSAPEHGNPLLPFPGAVQDDGADFRQRGPSVAEPLSRNRSQSPRRRARRPRGPGAGPEGPQLRDGRAISAQGAARPARQTTGPYQATLRRGCLPASS